MIKKNTKAIFLNGDFKGEYDWQGGIPLSEGEVMKVNFNKKIIEYELTKKEVSINIINNDQIVSIVYTFSLSISS